MLTELKGEILKSDEIEECISIVDTFPHVYHKYGTPIPKLDEMYWLRYVTKSENNFICFSRNTHVNPILMAMQEKVCARLQSMFLDDLQLDPTNLHFMKTKGYVPPHIDESNRFCSINIGVKNSESAFTRYSAIETQLESVFLENSRRYVCRDGYGVLLNTNSVHSVKGDPNVERILFTYGFTSNYDYVKSKIKE